MHHMVLIDGIRGDSRDFRKAVGTPALVVPKRILKASVGTGPPSFTAATGLALDAAVRGNPAPESMFSGHPKDRHATIFRRIWACNGGMCHRKPECCALRK